MKKPYILFAGVLIALILAFTFSQSYLTALEKETKGNPGSTAQKVEMEKFKDEVTQRIDETEASLMARLDSLEQRFRESQTHDTIVTPTPSATNKPKVQTATKNAETAARKTEAKPDSDMSDAAAGAPSDQENEIYLKYLKRRWALPADLTAYETKLAKDEIMQEVGRQYNMSAEEVLQLIDRVYAYRQAKKQR
jgi:hypothetical protein